MLVKSFVFNPIQVNTYLLYDESKKCAIIDAGCLQDEEQAVLAAFIDDRQLQVECLLNTHLHFDHALGNAFVSEKYGVLPQAHQADEFLIPDVQTHARMFGVNVSVKAQSLGGYLNDGDTIRFGNSELKAIHVPGHSPGSLCYYCKEAGLLFSGDVLFEESIGRTDLPKGSYSMLITGIAEKLFVLPNETVVYPGHDVSTTIGHEKQFNPYF